jgi:hypothetical protein
MTKTAVRTVPLIALGLLPVEAVGQQTPAIPEELQRTYGAFATTMVEGDADDTVTVNEPPVR